MPNPASSNDVVKVPVLLGPSLALAKVPIVTGFIPAGLLIPDNYTIPYLDSRTGNGYQRPPQEARVNELSVDLRKHRVDVPTSVLLNIREGGIHQEDGNSYLLVRSGGTARRQKEVGKFYIVDGQHRILALKRLIEEFDADLWSRFPLPFVCMIGGTEHAEMEQFYLVNSKAKSVRTDLAYELLYQRSDNAAVMEGLIDRGQDWQVHGQRIAHDLSDSSPVWRGLIRFAAAEKKSTILPSASLVTSLKPVLSSLYFKSLDNESQVKIIDAYWRGIRGVLPEAFDKPSDYTLQKGIGAIVMHTILVPVLEIARSQGKLLTEPETYAGILKTALENLQGDDSSGALVTGGDFWRTAPRGAAGSYSSSAGRRVLIAKIQSRLPKITTT